MINFKDNLTKPSRNLTQWSIDHPYSIWAFYLGILILAVLAIGFYMPRRMMPYVESPMIGVVTMMPGYSAQEMEKYIAKPIEEQLVNVKNLHYIRSTSQDGFAIVSLEFFYKTDMKKALFDVQSLMNIVQANLPSTGANLKPSWVVAIDPLNLPVLSLHLSAQGWNWLKLREFADNEVVNRLKTIKNVYRWCRSAATSGNCKSSWIATSWRLTAFPSCSLKRLLINSIFPPAPAL
jgi:HAE1 family hydrophobic/amphiphilic exporter-1